MIGLLLAPAFAVPRVTVVDGPLHPGRATWIEVADDVPGAVPPAPVVRGGAVRSWIPVRPGVWRALFVPAANAEAVEVTIAGQTVRRALTGPSPARLSLPEQVDGVVGGATVDVPIAGFDGFRDDLQVDASEGRVRVEREGDAFVARLTPDPLSHPRWVLVSVRDRRTSAAPAVTRVRLRARPRIAFQVEPGVSATFEIGGRPYGPFVADATGQLEGRGDQYPGEATAVAVLSDPLGNVTRTELPLVAETAPTLLVSPGESILPGRPPPLFHVAALTPVGAPPSGPPTCRAPFGELPVFPAGPGRWFGALPPLGEAEDVRVVCSIGDRQGQARVPVAPVPARVSLRVWPEEIRADFPTAEIRVALEDWSGERLPVDRVALSARVGRIEAQGDGRAEYDGAIAVSGGRDTIEARYVPPPGSGPPVELELGWTAVTPAGFTLHARALDALRRPLAERLLTLAAGEETFTVATDDDGWASAVVSPDVAGPLPVSARWAEGALERHGFVLPREPAQGGPGVGVSASVDLSLRPGRVAGLDVDVEPAELRAGPGAIAWVVVRLEDGLGQPIVDEPITLEASEGTVGPLQPRPDGSLVAEYQPLPVAERREVEFTASTSTVHGSARLSLEPREVRYSLGPWVGASTNFGPRIRSIGGLDLDARLRNPLVGEALIVRLGVWVSAVTARVETGLGPPAELRSTLVPGSVALLLRDDRGPWSLWGGVGLAAGVQHLEARLGSETVVVGDTWIFGPELQGAVARRAPAGEVALGLRGTWLQASDAEIGYSGNLGGVAATLGYRVVW